MYKEKTAGGSISYLSSLNGRITLVLGTVLCLVVAVMYASSYYGQRNLTAAMDRSALNSHSILLKKLIDTEYETIQERLSRILTRNVVDAFSKRDRDALMQYALPPFNRISTLTNFTRLSFYTTDGEPFLNVHDPAGIVGRKPRALIRDALVQRKILHGMETVDDGVAVSVVWPVYTDGELVGVAEGSGELATVIGGFAKTVNGIAGFVQTPAAGAGSSGLTMISDEAHSSVLHAALQHFGADAQRAMVERDSVVWQASLLPLRGHGDAVLGNVLIGEDVTDFARSLNNNTLRNTAVTAAGVFVALVIALAVIGRNMSRLSDMIAAVRHFANGNYAIKVPPQKRDEIGLLGEALDMMIKRVGETQEALIKSEKEAQEANRAKSAFLANMTHELRTPLNAIIGYGEILRDEFAAKQDSRTTDDLLKMVNAGRGLLRLIDEILEISKIEAGTVAVYCEKFDVNRLIDDVVTAANPRMLSNKNELIVERSEGARWAFADPEKTAKVMHKIIDNAAKFTHDGKVVVSVTNGDANWIEIAVMDSGEGIDQAAVRRLFQPFFQADESTTRRHGGTGLGLAIAKRLTQLMGGDIMLESEVGRGSTFKVKIPSAAGMSV